MSRPRACIFEYQGGPCGRLTRHTQQLCHLHRKRDPLRASNPSSRREPIQPAHLNLPEPR